MKTLQEILGAKNLIGVIKGVADNAVQQGLLGPEFFTPTKSFPGDKGNYIKVDGTRKTARLAAYGSPSRLRSLVGISEIPVTLMNTAEHIFFSPTIMMQLQSINDEGMQKMGIENVGIEVGQFARYFQNLRDAAVFSALCTGYIHFDNEGNLLPSAAGAAVTIDFGLPAGNRDQLDVLGAGDIIDATWSAAGSDIVQQILNLKGASVQLTGYRIKYAFYGKNIVGYLQGNTALSKYLENQKADLAKTIAGGEVPDGLLGLIWKPLHEAGTLMHDGNFKFWCPDNTVCFSPVPSPDWWGFLQGGTPVATDIGTVTPDAVSMIDSINTEFGMYSYCVVENDPCRIKMVSGDVFLPTVKVPKALFIADIEF